jgi:hypothetical protein
MDQENLLDDKHGIWLNDGEGDNVAVDLANRVEEEVCSLTFKETYVGSEQPIIRKVESLYIKRSILSRREIVPHLFPSTININAFLHVLRKISPLIGDRQKPIPPT